MIDVIWVYSKVFRILGTPMLAYGMTHNRFGSGNECTNEILRRR